VLLEAIASVMAPDIEVVVVDNASSDGSADAVAAQFPSVTLVRSSRNIGFAAGVNRAAQEANSQALLVLNADARLDHGALDLLLEFLDAHPRAALVAPALCYPDGRAQSSAFTFPGLLQTALDLFPVERLMETPLNGRIKATAPRQIDVALGACMLIRRAAWDDVGPLDEGYFMYVEEVDWCRRARQRGWQIWQQPVARAIHHSGLATRQRPDAMFAELWRSRLRYYERFAGPLTNRLIHRIVRAGLERRHAPAVSRIRQLVR
jgi:N-acetylglucosaminyl-diphospho-decaprenol L-rhamnosyltransferase